jgi:tRNA-specific 2-thiouridylase
MRLAGGDLALAGALERPDGDGAAGGSACGGRVRITIALEGGRIAAARFAVTGCPAATAAAAWCAQRAQGAAFLDAARLSLASCLAERGIAPDHASCAAVALDGLHAALGDALAALRLPAAEPPRTAVAMSGGVDSAVALLRVRAKDGDAVGLTLRLWIDPAAPDVERACCSPEAVRRARATCHALGLPHVTIDGREPFRRAVVDPFVAGYAAGETPNPCTLCNGSYRLEALAGAAGALGARRLATGHYARLVRRGAATLVARGADPDKDQSYMLATVREPVLSWLAFPLGDARKAEVRAEARAAGLEAAAARESQDVCFLGGGDLRSFLAREGVVDGAGEIRDEQGDVVGRHAGARAFTPGQRRGLGVAAPAPLYVLRTDPAERVVVVGPRERLARREVVLRDPVLGVDLPDEAPVYAKLRARSPAVAASATPTADGRLRLRLAEAAYGVARGQTAVLYDDEGAVVGAGTIAGDGGAQ